MSPVRALGPPDGASPIVLVLGGPIARADIALLCDRVRLLLEGSGAGLVVCDVGALVDPDAVTIDALARLQLTARRAGSRIQVHHPCRELQELLALAGLCDVLPLWTGLPLRSRGQTEEREQGGGVEEEADPGDPTA
jgi:ABC-type transporter Mla MlaB component